MSKTDPPTISDVIAQFLFALTPTDRALLGWGAGLGPASNLHAIATMRSSREDRIAPEAPFEPAR